MIIAGAGGHALEVKEELEKLNPKLKIEFFDDAGFKDGSYLKRYPMYQDVNLLRLKFEQGFSFALGIGAPNYREKFVLRFEAIGGHYSMVHSKTAQISVTAEGSFDAMAFSFIGPYTKLGKGSLINTRAHVHHEAIIGEYSEIGPGALILGQVRIGNKCRIGAGAVLLPGIELGDEVIVGAGAVVTKNVESNQTIIGVPSKPKN